MLLDRTHIDNPDGDPSEQHSYTELSHRSGGPNTQDGKHRSSQNSLKHGCRSNILILDNEDPAEFEALRDRWLDAYQPDTEASLELTEQFILNKWYLLRNERRFNEVEYQLSFFPYTKWDEQQHKIYQLTLRYKTAADRAASKSQRDLEDYLKNRRADEKHAQRLKEQAHASYRETEESVDHLEHSLADKIKQAQSLGIDVAADEAALADTKKRNRTMLTGLKNDLAALDARKTRAQLLFQGQNSPKKLRKIHILDQWVEVTVQDGITLTQLTPSNEKLIERGQAMDPPPELVYRRLCFPNGIPDEYDWTTDDPAMKKYGGLGTQRMTVDTWLDLIDAEKLRSDGHIGPCGDPLPRPRERGACDCPACEFNRQRLATRARSLKPQS